MIHKLSIPVVAVLAVGLAVIGVSAAWLRNTVASFVGKQVSDRNLKTDVTPVRW